MLPHPDPVAFPPQPSAPFVLFLLAVEAVSAGFHSFMGAEVFRDFVVDGLFGGAGSGT